MHNHVVSHTGTSASFGSLRWRSRRQHDGMSPTDTRTRGRSCSTRLLLLGSVQDTRGTSLLWRHDAASQHVSIGLLDPWHNRTRLKLDDAAQRPLPQPDTEIG